VDCTGARSDFKYNDKYVDKEDAYRHSKWLSFMSKRLKLAKNLLKETGVVFISIDDNEVAQLKILCDEIFGENTFISQLVVVNNIAGRSDKEHIAQAHEYILIYEKTNQFNSNGLELKDEQLKDFKYNDITGRYRLQGLRKRGSNSRREDRPNLFYPIYFDKTSNKISTKENEFFDCHIIIPKLSDGSDGNWRWSKDTLEKKKDFIEVKLSNKKFEVFEKVYLELDGIKKTTKMKSYLIDSKYTTDFATSNFKKIINDISFTAPKSVELIKDLLLISTNSDSLLLDFFAGSGTTLHATMQLNLEDGGSRQCILVTNNENKIAEEICYERNKRVIKGYSNSKGEKVEGLKNNNFRYYITDFVGRDKTSKNKRKLTELATDMLCIKEDCFNSITNDQLQITKGIIRLFENDNIYMMIILEEALIENAVEIIKNLEKPVKVYIFSPGQYPFTDDFEEVLDKVELCALPEAIYKAYKAILPKKKVNEYGENIEDSEEIELEGK
jgi:adenine-specific DNA-methyltransferase